MISVTISGTMWLFELESDYGKIIFGLESDYEKVISGLESDYEKVISGLESDYEKLCLEFCHIYNFKIVRWLYFLT